MSIKNLELQATTKTTDKYYLPNIRCPTITTRSYVGNDWNDPLAPVLLEYVDDESIMLVTQLQRNFTKGVFVIFTDGDLTFEPGDDKIFNISFGTGIDFDPLNIPFPYITGFTGNVDGGPADEDDIGAMIYNLTNYVIDPNNFGMVITLYNQSTLTVDFEDMIIAYQWV